MNFLCGECLCGTVIFTSVSAIRSHFVCCPSSFHAPYNKHTHTHTHTHTEGIPLSLSLTFILANALHCLPLLIQTKLPQSLKVIGYRNQIRSLTPDLCPVIRCGTRWRPLWENMEWTPSRCSWPTKIWWCWETLSFTRLCRPVRTLGPSHASTLRTESWWPRCTPNRHSLKKNH